MERYYRCIAGTWNNRNASYNANMGRITMKQKLLKLCRLDVLAVGLALLALAVACCSHHRTHERLNEMEHIGTPHQTHPPVKLGEERP